jgi:hypothetical protein
MYRERPAHCIERETSSLAHQLYLFIYFQKRKVRASLRISCFSHIQREMMLSQVLFEAGDRVGGRVGGWEEGWVGGRKGGWVGG